MSYEDIWKYAEHRVSELKNSHGEFTKGMLLEELKSLSAMGINLAGDGPVFTAGRYIGNDALAGMQNSEALIIELTRSKS